MNENVAPPITFSWDGEHMVPLCHLERLCDKYFVIGQTYQMVEQQERSHRSHAHYFACVNEAWKNLPEDLTERFPTSEHLRKYGLIRAGFADSRQIVASSKAEARRIASFVKPCDEYAVITAKDCVVTIWTARSQSMRAMGKIDFQRSKDGVLDALAKIIGTTTDDLKRNAQEAA